MLGIKPAVAAITAAAMRGEIDFRESLERRVALLAGLPERALLRVYDERLRLSPGAERLIAGFKAVGAKILLVSGGFTFFTDRLRGAPRLRRRRSRTRSRIAGRQAHRAHRGARSSTRTPRRRGSPRCAPARAAPGEIAVAIGDGANDLPMLRAADVSIAYHAKPLVRAQATYAINSLRPGRGAQPVRVIRGSAMKGAAAAAPSLCALAASRARPRTPSAFSRLTKMLKRSRNRFIVAIT